MPITFKPEDGHDWVHVKLRMRDAPKPRDHYPAKYEDRMGKTVTIDADCVVLDNGEYDHSHGYFSGGKEVILTRDVERIVIKSGQIDLDKHLIQVSWEHGHGQESPR